VVRANGEHTYTEVARGLSALQSLVDGFVESVHLDGSTHVMVNESGLLDGRPLNELATHALHALRPETAGVIVLLGDAVFAGFTSTGDETHCPTRIWDLIVRLAAEAGIPHGGPAERSAR
jgi:hypothetical protein